MTYTIWAELDDQWFDILGQITAHQEGFVWLDVTKDKEDACMCSCCKNRR